MKVEIIVRRKRYPIIGQVIDVSEKLAQSLIDKGLAKKAGSKKKKTDKTDDEIIIIEE